MITFKEYATACQRTMPNLGSNRENIIHMLLGIQTEVGELADIYKRNFAYKKPIDIINVKEEIGDLCWYATNHIFLLINSREDSISQIESDIQYIKNELNSHLESNLMVKQMSLINQYIYTCFAISAHLDNLTESIDSYQLDMINTLFHIIALLEILCEKHKISFDECLTKNILKLYVRYPEKFSEDQALCRNLDLERQVLENE